MKPTMCGLQVKGILVVLLVVGMFVPALAGDSPAYYPGKADGYRDYKVGCIHGVQYWVNPGATPESIDRDFRAMAQEDYITGARLAFWCLPVSMKEIDWTLWDACFDAAAKYGIKLNPVLPQIDGWLDGKADQPENRQAYQEHITKIVSHCKDKPALAMWTVDIEPSRSWKVEPCPATLALYRQWLPKRYAGLDDFKAKNNGAVSFETAIPVNGRDKGPWNNYQGFNDWLTFTAWALTEQTLFTANLVRQIDPVHPTSCTPPDTLHNQIAENGRNMWWLADAVDYPSSQMHAHWHLEMADMPADVVIGQACSVRKVYCASRGRPASYIGEVLVGPETAFESTRFWSPTDKELMCTTLALLGEGVKGYFYWLWNVVGDSPLDGAWSYRNLDGSPSTTSKYLGHVGKMMRQNNDLLYRVRPADAPVAIFDSLDAAIYLYRRSQYHPMSEWYVKNQYGFFKALRKMQIGCDFIDEKGLMDGTAAKYRCIYVPFSMTMEKEIAEALKKYVADGGTILADCMTAYTPRNHKVGPEQPGFGLEEVFGLKARRVYSAYDGWTEVQRDMREVFFDRMVTNDKQESSMPLYDGAGKPTALVASKLYQVAEPTTAKVLYYDRDGQPVSTVNAYGKGTAIWTGTLLGYGCRPADCPEERYAATAALIKPYIPAASWTLEAPANTFVCRRLSDGGDDVFVLVNESGKPAKFKLVWNRKTTPRELLWTDKPAWEQSDKPTDKISGTLGAREGTVIYCPR